MKFSKNTLEQRIFYSEQIILKNFIFNDLLNLLKTYIKYYFIL